MLEVWHVIVGLGALIVAVVAYAAWADREAAKEERNWHNAHKWPEREVE